MLEDQRFGAAVRSAEAEISFGSSTLMWARPLRRSISPPDDHDTLETEKAPLLTLSAKPF